MCISTSKCMLAHAFASSKMMKNIGKWWKKYLFHHAHKRLMWDAWRKTKKEDDFQMFFIVAFAGRNTQQIGLGQSRIAVFEDCKTAAPWLDCQVYYLSVSLSDLSKIIITGILHTFMLIKCSQIRNKYKVIFELSFYLSQVRVYSTQ